MKKLFLVLLFSSSVFGQKSQTYDLLATLNKPSIFSIDSFPKVKEEIVLSPRVERDLELRFSGGPKRFVYELDLRSVGVSAVLQARTEVWRQDLGDSGKLNFRKNRLGYIYAPRDFREGPVGRSVMPLLRALFDH